MSYVLGVDIGGTFTDVAMVDIDSGEQTFYKTPSTPADDADAVVGGIGDLLARDGRSPQECIGFVHGTTLALNAILTRTGARLGLLVTRGFRDILEIGRLAMPDPFDLYTQKPEPLLRKEYVAEVNERILGDGTLEEAIDEASLERSLSTLLEKNVEAIVVCFLNSYRDDSHEAHARDWIRARHPDLKVWLSSEVWPEIREYERALVTVMNGYVGPRTTHYLSSLEEKLRASGLDAPVNISTSNGGVMPARLIPQRPGSTIFSGPAAGVIAAARLAETCGISRAISLDMGGTSADFSVVTDFQIPYSTTTMVGGLPMVLPTVEVVSVGAGGGSIARLDNLGVLKVGPESAGSTPGPACYARGGTEPTITDAYVVCGWLDPARFLGGRIQLDSARAHDALARLAADAAYSPAELAEGILKVATANLAAGIGRVESRTGIDIRDHTLLAHGGAGPTHACMLAEAIGVGRVAVPLAPGTLSALGAIFADFRIDFVRSFHLGIEALDLDELRRWFEDRFEEARQMLTAEVPTLHEIVPLRKAELRYEGQGFNLELALTDDDLADETRESLIEAFHRRYEQVYGTADLDSPVEFMNARATIVGARGAFRMPEIPRAGSNHGQFPDTSREIFLGGTWLTAPTLSRGRLLAGFRAEGPCVIEQDDTTVVVPPEWKLEVDPYGVVHLERSGYAD